MSKLKLAAALITGALAATCWWGWLMLAHSGQDAQALAGIWGLPMPDEISQTCSILGLFIGALIGVSEFKALKSK